MTTYFWDIIEEPAPQDPAPNIGLPYGSARDSRIEEFEGQSTLYFRTSVNGRVATFTNLGPGGINDQELYIEFQTAQTAQRIPILVSGTSTTDRNSINLNLNAGNQIRLDRYVNNGYALLASNSSFTWSVNTWLSARIRTESDGTCRVKLWDNASPEPPSWSLSAANAVNGMAAGLPGLLPTSGRFLRVRRVGYADAGEIAPTEPSAGNIYEVATSDGISAIDLSSLARNILTAATDGLRVMDTPSVGNIHNLLVADGVITSDDTITGVLMVPQVSDGILTADSGDPNLLMGLNIVDGTRISDSAIAGSIYLVNVGDGTRFTDTISAIINDELPERAFIVVTSKSGDVSFVALTPEITFT